GLHRRLDVGHPEEKNCQGKRAEGKVDVEDPAPVHVVGKGPADERADHARRGEYAGHQAYPTAPLCRREDVAEDSEGNAHDHPRREHAGHGAGHDDDLRAGTRLGDGAESGSRGGHYATGSLVFSSASAVSTAADKSRSASTTRSSSSGVRRARIRSIRARPKRSISSIILRAPAVR